MYIPPVVVGILGTLLFELIALVSYTVWKNTKGRK